MKHLSLLTRGVALSALIALSAAPVTAGPKTNRARAAIAEAKGKVEAAARVGAGGEAPELHARAQAALANAEAELANGKKVEAISDARHASELADMAISTADRNKVEGRLDAEASAAAAARAANAANNRAEAATDRADAANDRANAAQQAAAVSAAQAEALRNAPPPAPAPTTTVAVEKTVVRTPAPVVRRVVVYRKAPVRHTKRHVVRARPVVTEKTTTTVTTRPN